MRTALIISTALLALLAAPAHADYIIFGTQTDHPVVAGRGLDDVRLSVGMTVNNGLALLTFTNVSVATETAVFKEIVIDGYDDDTATAILWQPDVLTETKYVDYCVSKHPNGLPGYHSETSDAVPLVELQAKSSPVKYGLGRGEVLEVRFNTSLADGSTINDYFSAFGGGDDTAAYSIGFHAISSAAVNGKSLSGVVVPEPTTFAMLAFGGLAVLYQRSKR